MTAHDHCFVREAPPFAAQARKAAAIRDARDRFYTAWLKLSADMAAEIARIERS